MYAMSVNEITKLAVSV